MSIITNIFKYIFSNVSGFFGNKFFFGILISVISFCSYSYYSLYKENIKLEKTIISITKESSIIEEKLKNEIILIRLNNNNDIEINLMKKQIEDLKRINEQKIIQEKLNKEELEKLNKYKNDLNNSLNKFSKEKCLSEKVNKEYINEIKRLLE